MGEERRRSAAEWAELVRSWRRSGRAARAFAASRGVNATTLKWWAWRLGDRAGGAEARATPELVAVQVMGDPPRSGAVAGPPLLWCEVEMAGGDVVRVFDGAPLEIVRAVVESALASRRAVRRR